MRVGDWRVRTLGSEIPDRVRSRKDKRPLIEGLLEWWVRWGEVLVLAVLAVEDTTAAAAAATATAGADSVGDDNLVRRPPPARDDDLECACDFVESATGLELRLGRAMCSDDGGDGNGWDSFLLLDVSAIY